MASAETAGAEDSAGMAGFGAGAVFFAVASAFMLVVSAVVETIPEVFTSVADFLGPGFSPTTRFMFTVLSPVA